MPTGLASDGARTPGRPANAQAGSADPGNRLDSSPLPDPNVASIASNEAQHASVAAPPIAHQVAGQIIAASTNGQREDVQQVNIATATPITSAPPIVKILRLNWQPADLGTITIRMSLTQDALDIRVEASRSETAHMLQRDQDSLTKLLTSAGYRMDSVTVVAVASDTTAVADGRGQSLSSMTPQNWGSSDPDSRSSGGRWNADPDPRTSRDKQNDEQRQEPRCPRRWRRSLCVARRRWVARRTLCEREMARAAQSYGVPLGVLYAVGLAETGRGDSLRPYALNIEGKSVYDIDKEDALRGSEEARPAGAKMIDVGCMQINHHFHASQVRLGRGDARPVEKRRLRSALPAAAESARRQLDAGRGTLSRGARQRSRPEALRLSGDRRSCCVRLRAWNPGCASVLPS